MSIKLNPILPFGQIYNSPAWILRDNLTIKMVSNDTVYLEVLESDFNGHILMAKNQKSNLVKFVRAPWGTSFVKDLTNQKRE